MAEELTYEQWKEAALRAREGSLIPGTTVEQPAIGQGEALRRGVEQGGSLGFSDELKGLGAASGLPDAGLGGATFAPKLVRTAAGALRMIWSPEARETYGKTRDTERERNVLAQRQHPATSTIGEVGGGLAAPMPGMLGARGLQLVGRGAGYGGGYGLLEAAGRSQGTPGAGELGLGAALGTAVGGGLPVVGGVAKWALAKPANWLWNTVRPNQGAERAVGSAARENARLGRQTGIVDELTPQQMLDNPEAVLMDTLGEPGRQLARSASNLSAEAHGQLQNTMRERAAARPDRAVAEINDIAGNISSANIKQGIRQEGRDTSDPLYEFARRQGNYDLSTGVAGSQGLPRLLERSPSLRRAAGEAEGAMQDLHAGYEQPWNGLRNLQYWDQVKQRLDVQINRAVEQGNNPEVARLTSLKGALTERLDRQVPGYAEARANSEQFFGSGNAVTSGERLHGRSQDIEQHLDAIRSLRPADQRLAAQGLLDRVRQQATADPNFWGKFDRNKNGLQQKLRGVLDPQEFGQLEARNFLERIMQLSHHAVSGNSSTIRQKAQLGLSSAAGAGLGYGASGDDPLAQAGAAGGGFTIGSAAGILMSLQDRRMANLIARALLSRDEGLTQRVADYVARDRQTMAHLRNATRRLSLSGSRAATGEGQPDDQ